MTATPTSSGAVDDDSSADSENVVTAPEQVRVEGASGALSVLRRGLARSSALRRGIVLTAAMASVTAIGRLAIPVLIQQVIDRGVDTGFEMGFTLRACGAALLLATLVFVAHRATYLRLLVAAEETLYDLRVDTFEHIHNLSLADHTDARSGVLVSRVTSDVETIAIFAQWGGIAWITNSILIVSTLLLMIVFSWQLALVLVAVLIVMALTLRALQTRQLRAYDHVRELVGDTLAEYSEAIGGAGVVRAYGITGRVRQSLVGAIRALYRAQMRAARFFAFILPSSEFIASMGQIAVIVIGVIWGPGWGLDVGELIACVFLMNLVSGPVAELGEVLDQTQTALAGWGKILDVLDQPIEVVEPESGAVLPDGPLEVEVDRISFAYRTGGNVLRDVSVVVPAGASVAVVGETGSGKTTLAKLLARLADPTEGEIRIGGVPLKELDADSRRSAIRIVPQDGFLFDATLAENVRYGRVGSSVEDVAASFERLGLSKWIAGLPGGLHTPVGERGENLSVGERQLVALARAQLANPGLLILDEATSSVDPETERTLAEALSRLTEGRTTISIAHRLSTAELADLVLVFDNGRPVEYGHHADLVTDGGIYANLYNTWLGNTR
jgi:putative ABC transport system ATP-binding protein